MQLPRRPKQPYLRYFALGGLGEVGMNCAVFEADGRLLIVDCGVTFPDSLAYGIDVIIPDFDILHEEAERIEALVITHGHMDHIGAVPYLLEELDIPVYGPALAIEMIRRMLKERDLLEECELHVIDESTSLELGPFTVEFPPVNHSIPHAHGLAIQTEIGLFVHTGDFKIDHQPVGEAPFDIARFSGYGQKGVRALFSDSTNAEVPGHSPSEREVRKAVRQVILEQDSRIFVALFSSNVFRMQSVLEAAAEAQRSVVLVGRSVETTLRAAERVGALEVPKGLAIIGIDQIDRYEDHELLFICTGSQAEPRAALTRLSNGDYPRLKLKQNDTIVVSARVIPGNERWVNQMYDRLARHNVNLITPDDAPIHASGHGYRDELRLMLNTINPQTLVPVHGDHRFQKAHAEIGAEGGVNHHFILDNGDILQFTKDGSAVVGRIETQRRVIDGTPFDDIEGPAFRQRRQIARAGLVLVDVVASKSDHRFLQKPTVLPIGAFLQDDEDGAIVMEGVNKVIERTWNKIAKAKQTDQREASEAIRIAVRKYLTSALNRRPYVVSLVTFV